MSQERPRAITITRIHPIFVAEVSGADLTRPLSREDAEQIEQAMDTYAVLVFHDQALTDAQQQAFSQNFGELENAKGGNVTKPEDRRLQEGMNDVSNLGKDNRPLAADSRQRLFNLGNRLWHSDSSFRAIPAKYSLLSARIVPDGGGRERSDGDVQTGPPEAGSRASGIEAQVALSLVTRRPDRRQTDTGSAYAAARSHRARDAAEVCLQSCLAPT